MPRVLFIIEGDPRISPRPAEAFRIAAGVAAWKKADVSVYLRGASVLALAEYTDELTDEDHFVRFLPILTESGRSIYVETPNPWLRELGEARAAFRAISDAELAALTTAQDCVIRFADRNASPPDSKAATNEQANSIPPTANPSGTQRHILAVLTAPNDALASNALRILEANGNQINTVDLTKTAPDYNALLDALFEADSAQVW
jgi:hypothetical protein